MIFTNRGWYMPQEPKPVSFRDFLGWDFFSHKSESGYLVSERLTGLAIVTHSPGKPATYPTRDEACRAAQIWLRHLGTKGFADSVVRVLNAREARR